MRAVIVYGYVRKTNEIRQFMDKHRAGSRTFWRERVENLQVKWHKADTSLFSIRSWWMMGAGKIAES